jgi:hypothetical protein
MAMRELSRTDIEPLFIVNHERMLPPLKRSAQIIRQDLEPTVLEYQLGVLTTWELYKLALSALKYGYSAESIRSVLLRKGLIDAWPGHYSPVGEIERLIPGKEVVGVRVKDLVLALGARVAVQGVNQFYEGTVLSLEVDGEKQESMSEGLAGVVTDIEFVHFRKGMSFYLVTT